MASEAPLDDAVQMEQEIGVAAMAIMMHGFNAASTAQSAERTGAARSSGSVLAQGLNFTPVGERPFRPRAVTFKVDATSARSPCWLVTAQISEAKLA